MDRGDVPNARRRRGPVEAGPRENALPKRFLRGISHGSSRKSGDCERRIRPDQGAQGNIICSPRLGAHSAFRRSGTQERQGSFTKDIQVFRGMVHADGWIILPENHIVHPVQLVFNRPMTLQILCQQGGINRLYRGNSIARIAGPGNLIRLFLCVFPFFRGYIRSEPTTSFRRCHVAIQIV